jgi:hypothetical protein
MFTDQAALKSAVSVELDFQELPAQQAFDGEVASRPSRAAWNCPKTGNWWWCAALVQGSVTWR